MKNLPAQVRNKAVEIANAMLEEKDADEGIAIATGISRAKDWAANRGKQVEKKGASRSTDVKQHGKDQYVIPVDGGWAIKEEAGNAGKTYKTKPEAVKAARERAKKANASLTIQRKDGKVQKRISYNPNNSGKKAA
jgi:uncharacterized protein YdaT